MTDADFERELFALYGEPSVGVADGGVTERILSDVMREERLRAWALGLAVGVGAGGGVAAAAALAGPAIGRLALQAGAPASVVWLVLPVAAIFMGWATLRVAVDN
jgi:hypothetical protein